ncbi:FAD-binding oxidoreductase [Vogesella sp. LIG4]|uniref:NAD(P)/FAD-dependent oxidoreductase n=1 Tax=Vogesella sp. LIG4 TaxID=1192162 RepID=UPI00082002AC|nr:FAD-binding oxidoreductase [Vogesella sp. LIG4]SCK21083.1 Glycine/D-amino acid oxidase [Vogesella sp. LIG4]
MPQSSDISLWMDQLPPQQRQPGPPLSGDSRADVVIVGAGYTGLWTAYYLKQLAPELDIAIVEAELAGYGASGRNGGWVIGELSGEERLLAGLDDAARDACLAILRDIPDEVGRIVARESLDCDFRKGGVLYCAARYPEQEARLRRQLAHWHQHGHGEADFRWLEVAELNRQLRIARPFGAVFSPHVATVQPARLVRELARCVTQLGVRLYEQTPATAIRPHEVSTRHGTLRADWVVPAVEAYSRTLPGIRGHQIPVQSMIIATEPLPQTLWDEIGLEHGQAFSEFSRLVSYGQRTRDNRLVFGARGGYRFGGKIRRQFALTPAEVAMRRNMMLELFPMLDKVAITHGWGGNLGVARGFQPRIVVDGDNKMVFAGGYGGEGVGASNLAGRSLAALITGTQPQLRQIPWFTTPAQVRHWEPEPLRWLGYNGIIRSFDWEDRVLNQHTAAAGWRRALAQRLAACMEGLMQ